MFWAPREEEGCSVLSKFNASMRLIPVIYIKSINGVTSNVSTPSPVLQLRWRRGATPVEERWLEEGLPMNYGCCPQGLLLAAWMECAPIWQTFSQDLCFAKYAFKCRCLMWQDCRRRRKSQPINLHRIINSIEFQLQLQSHCNSPWSRIIHKQFSLS